MPSKASVNDPTQIVISITKNFLHLKGDLLRLANEENRSLSNYLSLDLDKHLLEVEQDRAYRDEKKNQSKTDRNH